VDDEWIKAEEDRLNADISRLRRHAELLRAERKEWKEVRTHLSSAT
jgi:hypothetical protein